MLSLGHNRGENPSPVTVTELQQADHKGSNLSVAAQHTCCFYNDLHATLGRDSTSTLNVTGDTLGVEAPAVHSKEEGDLNHRASQELFQTLPESSQSHQLHTDEPADEGKGMQVSVRMHYFL